MSATPHVHRQHSVKKRVLIVNCYFDELRRPIRRSNKIPQAMAPAYLAGAFSRKLCHVRLYSELADGPLESEALLGWPDMLVLSGLVTALDRMLHLTAYARTKNPRVIVAAGGPAVRALPRLCGRFFDYCCTGDVEQMLEVITDAFGPSYAADEMIPRFDLAHWVGRVGYVETSRNCNFRCSFCSLTAEGRKYEKYELDTIQRHILATGVGKILVFLDNNFYGNDRQFFLARLELIRNLWKQGILAGWAALVSNDFFMDSRNLKLAKDSGCLMLFCGLESFSREWLCKFNKTQNTVISPLQMMHSCLDSGILFSYGIMLDPITRTLSELRQELASIIARREIPLPYYLSVPVPIPRTPFFYECVEEKNLLPLTKIRDLDSTTLTLRPMDPLSEVVAFIREIQSPRGYGRHAAEHVAWLLQRHGSRLNINQIIITIASAAFFCAPTIETAPYLSSLWKDFERTHVSSTEPPDRSYSPAFPVASRYQSYFNPTMLTDAVGNLTEDMQELINRKTDRERSQQGRV